MNIYDFTVKNTKKEDVPMADYKGKVLLIVNTATGCGFTPQYDGLSELYDKYRDRGFEVLDFPCNQFLGQAPGTDEEVAQFCKINFGTKFQTFAKINVNGKEAEPLFTYLKENAPDDLENPEFSDFKKKMKSFLQTLSGKDIKWNFTKFLVDRDGRVVGRFAPSVKPGDLEEHILKLL